MKAARNKILFLCIWLCCVLGVNGQTGTILTYQDYLLIVRQNHPMAIQAELLLELGNANLLRARGSFDPSASYTLNHKNYDGKEYYDLQNGALKIPTWLGLDFSAGIEQNRGDFLNPERNTPSTGLFYAGVSLPLGQGLFIDERRAQLKQAQIFLNITQTERLLMYNNLLLDAGIAYWDWSLAYNNLLVFDEAVQVAQQRFDAVRQSALLGDVPFIDTLEAGIQVQDRMLGYQQASLEYQNATANLEVFLWAEGVIPLALDSATIPLPFQNVAITIPDANYLQNWDSLVANHPILQQNNLKIDQLEVQRRLNAEMLKPNFNVKYSMLSGTTPNEFANDFGTNFAVWGLDFSMPLLLRKERGNLKMTKVLIQDAELGVSTKRAEINYKATAAANKWRMSQQQVELFRLTARDYNGLLTAERKLFEGGESSLFMVNARELGFINSQLKLNELITKNKISALETGFVFGLLPVAVPE